MRGSRHSLNFPHLRRWATAVVMIQLSIIAVMFLEGQFHKVPLVQPMPSSVFGSDVHQFVHINPDRNVSTTAPDNQKKLDNDTSHTLASYEHEDWMDRVLAIPAMSLTLLEDDGNSIGIPANYTVAAKIFKDSRKILDDEVNEMELHMISEHSNIVRFIGAIMNASNGETPAPAGFIMENFPGQQLETILDELSPKKLPPLPRSARYKIALDIAQSVAYLHSIRIIHFDVKPEQILVTGFPPSKSPVSAKLIDFGMAIHQDQDSDYVDAQLEGGARWRGTEHYLAPEIAINDRNVSEKVDVYSFGVVLWEMYTREYPYRGTNLTYAIERIKKNPIGFKLPEDTEPEWRDLIRDCLEWQPEDRPSFQELVDRLNSTLFSMHLKGSNQPFNPNSVRLMPGFDRRKFVQSSSYVMVGTHDLFKPWIPKQANFRQKRNDARKGISCPSFDTRLQRLNSSSFFNTYMVDLDELNHGKNIGEGEYGNVFLTNLTVKAKFFKEINAASLSEVRLLTGMRHPNILRGIGMIVNSSVGLDSAGVPIISGIVTEDLGSNSASLEDIRNIHRLTSHEIALVGAQIADALSYIHANGLTVLRVNPQNVLIQMNKFDRTPIAKLTDVSLAHCSKNGENIRTSPITGARGFVAPEVIDAKVPTHKADIFSLGKIMKFLCLEGRAPPDSPEGCSSGWMSLAVDCMRENPKDRPDAHEVVSKILKLVNQ